MNAETAYVQDEFYEGLLVDFLDEASQLLDRLNEDLLVLDEWAASAEPENGERFDDDLMNSMFRSAHSIKGLSAMLGLQNVKVLTHRIENIFDAARKDKLTLDTNAVEVIFRSVDILVEMVNQIRIEGNDNVNADVVINRIDEIIRLAEAESESTEQSDAEELFNNLSQTGITSEPSPPTNQPNESDVMTSSSKPIAPSLENEVIANSDPLIDLFAGIEDEVDVPPKYLSIFIDETEESIDSLTETLLNVEVENNSDTTQSLLIISHRIKGSAASVGLNRPAKLAHYMEDILQDLREASKCLSSSMVDAMLKCTDALRHYVIGLKSGEPESELFNDMAYCLLTVKEAEERGAVSVEPDSDTNQVLSDSAAAESNQPAAKTDGEHITGFDDKLVSLLKSNLDGGLPALAGRVHFEQDLPLAGLKGRLVYEKLSHLGEVFYCDPDANNLEELEHLVALTFGIKCYETHDSIKSKLQVSGVTSIEIITLVEQTDETPVATANSAPVKSEIKTTPIETATPQPSVNVSQAERKTKKKKSSANESSTKPNETLRVDIERLDQLMNLAGQLVINKARFTKIGKGLKESLPSKQVPQLITNAGILANDILSQTESANGKMAVDLESLRSNTRRLQADLQVIGREIQQITNIRNGVNDLFEAVHQLDRVANGIQQSVMDTRMVPIGPLFGRFRRMIRDITRTNGKDIRLVIRGEKTELDKRMIDELGDPLIHMVRNSADHGIESSQEREAAGKPKQGTITLDSFHRGNSIYIQITDDGKGLDKDKIAAKAIEKKFASRAEVEKMSAHQIYQMIWEPGLTTAEKVTEISGRGMGMDIVRSKIEELNGTVDVDNNPGEGATFTIKLPLTLAILPSLMAEIDGEVYALPVESVVEIVTIPRDEFAMVHNQTIASIRGRVVSVVCLNDLFTWSDGEFSQKDKNESNDCTLVIIGSEGQELGIQVDSLLGEEDVVIKSMAENYRNVIGVAGASILGNGRVSLILDINALIEMSSNKTALMSHE